MVQSLIQNVLSSSFLQPAGLLALLALVPLIVFYLIKQKPEEQVMPAMMFFMRQKESGKASQALKTLLRNLMLILHVLLIVGFAAALAHPFFEAPSTADETVVVLDRSASMTNNMEEARSFIGDNLGEKNTLIVVGDSIDVPLEKASKRQVESYIQNVESKDVRSDVANAIEIASDYEGTIVVASDLDHTMSQKSAVNIVENLRDSDRDVRTMNLDEGNSWGIVDVDPGKGNSSVEVKNFMDSGYSLTVTKDGEEKQVELAAGEVRTVTFSTPPGKNVIELEEDQFAPDNKAYISIPEDKQYRVAFITEDGNPYFEKAIELIDFTTIETVNPPVNRQINADIYVLDTTNRILSGTIEDIESDVENGASLVVFGHTGIFNYDLESLPARKTGGRRTASVEISRPRQVSLGETQVVSANRTRGISYASPEEAMIKASYGEGEVFFYNIDDRDFRFDFIYPVFWKKVLGQLTDRPSTQELNLETGEEINSSHLVKPSGVEESGVIQADESGFYETSSKTYAANLESEGESKVEVENIPETLASSGFEERDVQNLLALLIAFMLLAELGYLSHIGDA